MIYSTTISEVKSLLSLFGVDGTEAEFQSNHDHSKAKQEGNEPSSWNDFGSSFNYIFLLICVQHIDELAIFLQREHSL